MDNWLSSTTHWLKKQYFNGAHYLEVLALQGQKLNEGDIYMFSIRFNSQNKNQAFKLYQSVLWFTYRDDIYFEDCPTLKSDVGWGCMLRVGQMMLAQTLRMQKGQKYYSDQAWLHKLLWDFINEKGKFSIEALVKIGNQLIQKKPGEWYSPFDISSVLQKALQNKMHQSKSNPNIESFTLEAVITSGQFSLSAVYDQTKIIVKSRPDLLKTKPCLLIVICRMGYQKAEEQLLNHLKQILRNEKNCVGLLGGRPNKAHYIFGTTENSFIYLDPHCVRSQLNIQSFLCETFFSMPHDKIDPSLGICFYFPNFKQMILTYERLRKLNCNGLVFCHEHEKFDCIGLEVQEQEQEIFEILA